MDNKAIMQSVRPKWCELIAAVIKKIEVRKSKPKLETPFKCYIYQSTNQQKVIGEYVCDEISEFTVDEYSDHLYYISDDELAETCLSQEELWDYGKGKTLYGWHISNLKIYDKPKKLSKFRKPLSVLEKMIDDDGCWLCDGCPDAKWEDGHLIKCSDAYCSHRTITRPPQSWCYVEE